ncbi:MAG: response regulator transcription factor [Cyclobacteriaceae bacterium]|nr:response regulator transcription factor [Cyclobacteriaceae bacterium]
MNVVIIEDEALASERLITLLHNAGEPITIARTLESIEEAVTYFSSPHKTDLLFLDIELGDGKSFEIFKKVSVKVPIIFTTAYDQYALQAFKHFSIDYLLKPIEKDELNQAISKWKQISQYPLKIGEQLGKLQEFLSKANQKSKERILVKSGNRLQYKSTDEVAYFYADGKEVYIYTLAENKKFLIDYTLEQLELQLDEKKYFRISRKVIVNVEAIAEIKGLISTRLEIKLTQPCIHELLISRDRSARFKIWLDR